MPETEYYNSNNVLVTSSRFVVGAQTYPIAQLSSVSLVEIPPKTGCATWLMAGGVVALVIAIVDLLAAGRGEGAWDVALVVLAVALMLGAGGFALRRSTVTRYAVQIVTAAGQHRLLSSTDRSTPAAVVSALNEAIAARG